MTAAVLATALTLLPAASALATPADDALLEAKKAERAAALAELEAMKAQVEGKVAEYVALGRRMNELQAEVSEIESEVAQIDAELYAKELAFTDRAVELYRSGRTNMVAVLLGSKSVQDFFSRAYYLSIVNRNDNRLITELRLTRSESLWLQNNLADRIATLNGLQLQADEQRVRIEADIVAQEERAKALGRDIAELMRPKPAAYQGGAPQGQFDPDTVIADKQFRDHTSMNANDIQVFLERQPGKLKSYRAPDHQGRMKTAAQMIAEAAVAWKINPKVILVKLQKEQSLLARPNPSQRALDGAMGMGMTDSGTIARYQGFGNQIWWGTSRLHENSKPWEPGATLRINYGTATVAPTNASTYSLYKYTPHYNGNMSFWMLYWRYFGDPLAEPAPRPVPSATTTATP